MSDIPADELLAALERIRDVASRSDRASALDEVRAIAARVLAGGGGSDVRYDSEWLTPRALRVRFFANPRAFSDAAPEGAVSSHRIKQPGLHTNVDDAYHVLGPGSFDLHHIAVTAVWPDGQELDDNARARLGRAGVFQLVLNRAPLEVVPLARVLCRSEDLERGGGRWLERHLHVEPQEAFWAEIYFPSAPSAQPIAHMLAPRSVSLPLGIFTPALLTLTVQGRRTTTNDLLNELRILRAMQQHRIHRDEIEGLLGG